MARSLNKVQLIGNLTRDPELRYTPNGAAVCSFGLATNRTWVTEGGEKKEDAEFHNVVAWNKLAEICSQFLTKGRKAYVEGRIATRAWTAQDGSQRTRVEIIIDDMIILDSRDGNRKVVVEEQTETAIPTNDEGTDKKEASGSKVSKKKSEVAEKAEEVNPDDIPF